MVLVGALLVGAIAVTTGASLATRSAVGQTRRFDSSVADSNLRGQVLRRRGGAGAPSAVAKAHDGLARLASLGEPVYCGAGTKPLVALTFDDGPGILTPRALKLLRSRQAKATFFLVGKLLEQPGFAAVAAFEARHGMALGNHTWDHVSVAHGSAARYTRQITSTSHAVQLATGQWPRLFRPPFGAHDRRLDRWLRAEGMIEILWSTDSLDSQGATTRGVLRTVLRGLRPGAIILLHDNRGTTETALPRILRAIQRRGLTAVTVPDLLTMDPPTDQQLRQHTCG